MHAWSSDWPKVPFVESMEFYRTQTASVLKIHLVCLAYGCDIVPSDSLSFWLVVSFMVVTWPQANREMYDKNNAHTVGGVSPYHRLAVEGRPVATRLLMSWKVPKKFPSLHSCPERSHSLYVASATLYPRNWCHSTGGRTMLVKTQTPPTHPQPELQYCTGHLTTDCGPSLRRVPTHTHP